jgi:hypothetical protein
MSAGAQLFTSPVDLMRALGSKEGYDPMPPSQHRFFMDRSQPPMTRVMGLLFASTIHPGKGRKRSTYARDRFGRPMKQKDFCEVLGIDKGNMTTYFKILEEQGRLRVADDERIYLGGNAQEPVMQGGEEEANNEEGVLCTKDFPRFITEYLQQLGKIECQRATTALLSTRNLYKQRQADAIALLRAQEDADMVAVLEGFGYRDQERTGRPREPRPNATVRIEFLDPNESFVQKTTNGKNGHSAHKTEPASAQNESGSVHEPHPYYSSETPLPRQSEVERPHVEKSVSGLEKEAPAARPDDSPTPPTAPLKTPVQEQVNPLDDPNPVIRSVQHYFGRKLAAKDPLQTKFAELAAKLEIPVSSVCRWIGEKSEQKEKARYHIYSPGALYEFAVKDLPGWIKTHRREIATDADWERRQREEFDPASYNAEMRALAAKKGMR